MIKEYLENLFAILLRPIWFFTFMPEGDWNDKPITFAGITAAFISFGIVIIVFWTQYSPISITLLEKVQPTKYLIITPVMATLAFTFFVITFSIAFGVLLFVILSMFWFLGVLLFLGGNILGGYGDYFKDIKASFYSSAVSIVLLIPIFFVFLTKSKLMIFTNYVAGYNICYWFTALFLYGLQAIIARKVHNLRKWKAFVAALLPLIFMIIIGLAINKFILPKVFPWVM